MKKPKLYLLIGIVVLAVNCNNSAKQNANNKQLESYKTEQQTAKHGNQKESHYKIKEDEKNIGHSTTQKQINDKDTIYLRRINNEVIATLVKNKDNITVPSNKYSITVTEPFIVYTIDDEQVTVFEERDGTGNEYNIRKFKSDNTDYLGKYRIDDKSVVYDVENLGYILLIHNYKGTDGMSDKIYPFQVYIFDEKETLSPLSLSAAGEIKEDFYEGEKISDEFIGIYDDYLEIYKDDDSFYLRNSDDLKHEGEIDRIVIEAIDGRNYNYSADFSFKNFNGDIFGARRYVKFGTDYGRKYIDIHISERFNSSYQRVYKRNNNNLLFQGKESGTFTDYRDGSIYEWVRIGEQIWMAENLAFLPEVGEQIKTLAGGGTSSYNNYYVFGYNGTSVEKARKSENYKKYGVLYDWRTACKVCPDGWHLPINEEWEQLISLILEDKNITKKAAPYTGIAKYIKSANGWSDTTGLDSYGFGGLPGGRYEKFGQGFQLSDTLGCWWTSTGIYDMPASYHWVLIKDDFYSGDIEGEDKNGYSVRCVKNNQ